MIFIFLRCCEKTHDKKEFSSEISKPFCESQIKTQKVEPCSFHVLKYTSLIKVVNC